MEDLNLFDKLYSSNLLLDEETVLLSEGFEKAIIGVTASIPKAVVYDYYKALDILMQSDNNIDIDDAIDWLEDHIENDLGSQTPIFIKKL